MSSNAIIHFPVNVDHFPSLCHSYWIHCHWFQEPRWKHTRHIEVTKLLLVLLSSFKWIFNFSFWSFHLHKKYQLLITSSCFCVASKLIGCNRQCFSLNFSLIFILILWLAVFVGITEACVRISEETTAWHIFLRSSWDFVLLFFAHFNCQFASWEPLYFNQSFILLHCWQSLYKKMKKA